LKSISFDYFQVGLFCLKEKTMFVRSILPVVFIIFLINGCSTTLSNRKSQENLHKYVKNGDFQKALNLVQSDKYYPEERSRLLKLLELGSAYYLSNNYTGALYYFDEAKELSELLFTQSVKGKIKSVAINDNMDKYYGEKYERSMIRFYQALTHFMLYQTGKQQAFTKISFQKNGQKKLQIIKTQIKAKELSKNERTNHLVAARATLLEWDSLLESYRSISGGQVTYKDDLLAKVFGAFIHEQMGTRSDRQIAQKAKTILFRNYNIFPSINDKYKSFKKNFNKFSQMDEKKIRQKFVNETIHAKALLSFLDKQIKTLKSNKPDNFFIFLQDELIAAKEAKKINFPIPASAMPATQGKDFTSFVMKILSIGSAGKPTITFELPHIKEISHNNSYKVTILSQDEKKEILKVDCPILDPLSDIAKLTLDEKMVANYSKVGLRVAGKHIAALLASYATYKSLKKNSGEFLAHSAAAASYLVANKTIATSELADLRHWLTLPSQVRVCSMKLPAGHYQLNVEDVNRANKKKRDILQNHPIVISKKATMLDLRIP
jgi:hypothetical protein